MVEFISSVKFCAPFYQIALLLGLSTLALIFGNPKIALLINYLFTLYWAYVFDRAYILEAGTKHSPIFREQRPIPLSNYIEPHSLY